jgi:hypothetical protein
MYPDLTLTDFRLWFFFFIRMCAQKGPKKHTVKERCHQKVQLSRNLICPLLRYFILMSVGVHVRFEVVIAATMKNAVFWDVTPCCSCKDRHFGDCIISIIRVTRIGGLGTLAVASNRSTLRRNTVTGGDTFLQNISSCLLVKFCML